MLMHVLEKINKVQDAFITTNQSARDRSHVHITPKATPGAKLHAAANSHPLQPPLPSLPLASNAVAAGPYPKEVGFPSGVLQEVEISLCGETAMGKRW